MNFTGMTVEEIIEYIFENESSLSSVDLVKALDSCSVIDPYAADDAVTLFYSGKEDNIVNKIAATDNSNIMATPHNLLNQQKPAKINQ